MPADALEIARVHVRSWQAGYRGLIADDFLDGLRPEDRAARYTLGDPDPLKPDTIVAIDGAAIFGFVTTGPASAETDGAGHLMALYVDPDHWRRGVGRRLVERARAELMRRGYREAVLWVLAGNRRAHEFYATDGWVTDGHEAERTVWGIVVRDLRYRRKLS